jgi:unconventional prefoldin RPB5 interactor 1
MTVRTRLTTLPDRTRYGIQVPIGSTASGQPPLLLMKGYIKHTNEILVLLGENWFLERSAKEAVEIINRRIAKTEAIIEKFKQEKEHHKSWINFVDTVVDDKQKFVDIKEECTEEDDKKWRELHRQKQKEFKMKEKQARERGEEREEDLDLMTRLQLLEEEEEQQEYLRQQREGGKTSLRQRIASDLSRQEKGSQEQQEGQQQKELDTVVTTLKGILKKKKVTDVKEEENSYAFSSTAEQVGNEEPVSRAPRVRNEGSTAASPFTGEILERIPVVVPSLEQHHELPSALSTLSSRDQTKDTVLGEQDKKPISRFKANRMKKL